MCNPLATSGAVRAAMTLRAVKHPAGTTHSTELPALSYIVCARVCVCVCVCVCAYMRHLCSQARDQAIMCGMRS